MSDWRYLVTYEGVVEADTENEAITAAFADVDNGKIPAIEVEAIGDE